MHSGVGEVQYEVGLHQPEQGGFPDLAWTQQQDAARIRLEAEPSPIAQKLVNWRAIVMRHP